MSASKSPCFEHERRESVVSYGEYRILCDTVDMPAYRKEGIVGEEEFIAAQQDPRTIYLEFLGRHVPLFAPLEYVSGYNVEGCRDLTQSEGVYILTLPFEMIEMFNIDVTTYLDKFDTQLALILQTPAEETDKVKSYFAQCENVTVNDFIDPRCPEGSQTASMAFYAMPCEAQDDDKIVPMNQSSLKEAYSWLAGLPGINEHTTLIEADDLRRDEALFKKLWDLHDEKFDVLGKYHPVSMQENEAFFRSVLEDEGTHSVVRFEAVGDEIVPVCHGCFLEDINRVYWLGNQFIKQIHDDLSLENRRPHFFYGITGKTSSDQTLRYASDVMRLNSRLERRRGGKVLLMFESTNLSSLYIPDLIQKYTDGDLHGIKRTGPIRQVSKVDYWYIKKG
jgi:hypothetical protein